MGDYVPAIIPPTYAKLTGAGWLRSIWARAAEVLRSAQVLVFIGYSMPESDGFIRALIQSAMARRESGRRLCVYVFDPGLREGQENATQEKSGGVRRRYDELFAPIRRDTELCGRAFGRAVCATLHTILAEYSGP